jgi:hypothetical protein
MTKEEYTVEMQRLWSGYLREKDKLQKTCAYSNQKFFKGQVISNIGNTVRIEIDRMSCYFDDKMPYLLYEGFMLTKEGNINKRKKRAYIAEKDGVLIKG